MEITKFRSQLSLALELRAAHIQGAWSRLATLSRVAALRLQEARRARVNDLHGLRASFQDATAVVNAKLTKCGSQLSIVFEQLAVHLQGAASNLARLGRGAALKLQEERRASASNLHRLQASFLNVSAAANAKLTKFGSQLSIAFEQLAVHLQGALSRLARVGGGAALKLQEARRASANELHRLQASFRNATAVTNAKITECGSQLSLALRRVGERFQRAQGALARFGRSVVDKPRRLQEARLAREKDLRTLLESSLDAVVVTDGDRRLVAANSQALDLFGVSESNISKFTIDTFLSHGQILDFHRNRSTSIKQEDRHGKCKIRRLDGTLRVAECIFVANVVPRRHLYRFLNVAPHKISQLRSPASYTQETRKPFDVHPEH